MFTINLGGKDTREHLPITHLLIISIVNPYKVLYTYFCRLTTIAKDDVLDII